MVAAASLAASALLTPGLVLAMGALGGAAALVLVEAVSLTGLLAALLPFVRLPTWKPRCTSSFFSFIDD